LKLTLFHATINPTKTTMLHAKSMTGGNSQGPAKPPVALVTSFGAAIDPNSAAGNIRVLKAGDEDALDGFLARHWLSSMVMRARRLAGGIVDEGKPSQGTYAAVWEGSSIVSVAAHYSDGLVAVQAPRSLAAVVRAAVTASRRGVAGFVGPWAQAEAAVTAVGRSQRRPLLGHPQVLLVLDLNKLQVPGPVKKLGLSCRPARPDEVDAMTPWRVAAAIDQMGAKDSPELRAHTHAETESLIAAKRLYIAETASPVGITVVDAIVPEAVQFGGVWTPPRLRNRGLEAAAAISLVEAFRAPAVKHVVMLATKTSPIMLRAYQSIGFTALGEYGTLTYGEEQR
jgi:predicted GNAT family acetyltransferase